MHITKTQKQWNQTTPPHPRACTQHSMHPTPTGGDITYRSALDGNLGMHDGTCEHVAEVSIRVLHLHLRTGWPKVEAVKLDGAATRGVQVRCL